MMQESVGKRLRRLIHAPEILALPGVFDGFSTRLVQRAGYKAAFITGSGVSEARLGQPDVGLMGLEENVAAARAMTACSDLLLLADADTGYGNAVNVYHTVRAFERAGVAGLMLEDQVWPKRCGHMKGKEVIDAEEMVEKIRAAASARSDPDFVIKSRTDVLATHGLAEAIRRLNLYAEAGADLLFADAALSSEDIGTIARNVGKPLSVNMGFGIRQRSTTPLLSAAQLQALGVAVVIYPRMLTACALRGMENGLAHLRQSLDTGEVVDRPDALVSFEELNAIMGMSEIEDLERRFLTEAQRKAKYGDSGESVIVPDARTASAAGR
jgi:2-methylisocitrate lyase-like PEP mutase family enzyme